MKGYKAVRSFFHNSTQYYAGDDVNINEHMNKELERKGLIRWVERPELIKPDKTKNVKPKTKKRGRTSKK